MHWYGETTMHPSIQILDETLLCYLKFGGLTPHFSPTPYLPNLFSACTVGRGLGAHEMKPCISRLNIEYVSPYFLFVTCVLK